MDGVEGQRRPDPRSRGQTDGGGQTRGGGAGAAAERDRGEVGERRVGLASEGTGELWIRQWWTGLGRIV